MPKMPMWDFEVIKNWSVLRVKKQIKYENVENLLGYNSEYHFLKIKV